MPRHNTNAAYGSVTKTFHWMTALLIVTAFPLGVVANRLPYESAEQLAFKAQLFSIHKTLGVAIFFVALARIIWAFGQKKPGLLNADNRLEAFLAELVHWLLYLSLVLVPLSGWLHHAATQGFAPILWPLGQGLPLVPKSEAVAHFFGSWHFVMTKVLLASLALHVAGAFKHALLDRDGTLRRMWFGQPIAAVPPAQTHSKRPAVAGFSLYAVVILLASLMGLPRGEGEVAPTASLERVESEWTVTQGQLEIVTQQFGAPLAGSFADWTAQISFDEQASEGKHGTVRVEIAVASLTLGSVTSDALGAEFFDAESFPVAVFEADIIAASEGYIAKGMLNLKAATVAVELPFELTIEGDTARMTGSSSVDRRDFAIGDNYKSEGEVGFVVGINVTLTATR
ncbi:cytochrome b/b6 domain-containing protein [Lentibacter algarum]|uniref:cytochrome b/b6 domain-containing protein n=1 Tax=Lentibacter algarum TaxID=576131 RepID=UPI001C096C13|nr:cytochrome b/b6 domain-containing protein [Lentibacter algarum]MBU2982880.1 cytochrome b/b6 domain-containing protein [Lentibacter algarum]